jgi:hypothetical protein
MVFPGAGYGVNLCGRARSSARYEGGNMVPESRAPRATLLVLAAALLGLSGCLERSESPIAVEPSDGEPVASGRPDSVRYTLPDGSTQSLKFQWIDGQPVHQGDIILSRRPDGAGLGKVSGAGVLDRSDKWDGGVIRYVTSGLSSASATNLYAAMQYWTANTRITFSFAGSNGWYPWDPIVVFEGTSDNVCRSPIGYNTFGGTANIGPNCSLGNMIHELGHVVGLFHEQSRHDRDNFVNIYWANILSGNGSEFDKYSEGSLAGQDLGPYDYGSVMHYGAYAFSSNGKKTIEAKNGAAIGQRSGLSRGDLWAVRDLYMGLYAPMPLFMDNANVLWANLAWNLISAPVSFQQDGNRYAVLLSDKSLRVKEAVNGTWVNEIGDVKQYQIQGSRIGALTNTGILYVKEGALGATWVNERSDVKAFQLEGNRIAAQTTGNLLVVKEGALSATWITLTGNVDQFQLEGGRVGVKTPDGTLIVKEGSLSATWVTEIGGVKDWQLHGDKIGVLLTDNTFRAKQGGLSATWANLMSGAKDFRISGNIYAMRDAGNTLYAKEGLSGTWYNQIGSVSQYRVSGSAISVVLSNGDLRSKVGVQGIWDKQWTGVAAIEQANWK